MKRFLPRPLTAFLSTAFLPALLSSVMAQDPCKLTDIGTGTVASVRDGRTLLLADGGELRLAAIEVAEESRDALQSLVGGRDLRLKQLSPERDRYGRIVAFAYVGNSEQSVQQALLEQGRVRVSARTGSKANAPHGRHAAVCGPTPILPLCGQKIWPGLRLRGGNLHWWKARSCRCGRAAPQYI
ncbi:MAG: thermonuclease family protein [Pseudolabrys sp.]